MDDVTFVVVLYYDNGWISRFLKSFRTHFPYEPLLFADHMQDGVAANYVDKYTTVIDNPNGKNAGGHGGGMDAAADYLRAKGVKYMVHLEPDCTISGRLWFYSMLEAVENGADMAGPVQFPYGPIHPCPSIWRTDAVKVSFKPCLKTHEPNPKVYDALRMVEWLAEVEANPSMIHAHTALWDTGLYAWHLAAIDGKAVATSGDGIEHHWAGRTRLAPGSEK